MNNRKTFCWWLMLVCIAACFVMPAGAFTELKSGSEVKSGCVQAQIWGDYVGNATSALKLINYYRKEACEKHYPDPRNRKRRLKKSDYVPIKWSSDLQYIARIRAAEASIAFSHTRPNGESGLKIISPNGIISQGECLAASTSGKDMKTGVKRWYAEKSAWTKGNVNKAGHYMTMINPANRYVGLSAFRTSFSKWRYVEAGEFSTAKSMTGTVLSPGNDYHIITSVKKASVGSLVLFQENKVRRMNNMEPGDALSIIAAARYGSTAYVIPETVTWSSSNSAVASVEPNSKLRAKKTGESTISASTSLGKLSGVKAIVKHHLITDKSVAATCTNAGKTGATHCTLCSYVQKASVSIPAKGHKVKSWTVTKKATTTSTGSRYGICSVCRKKITEVIPKIVS